MVVADVGIEVGWNLGGPWGRWSIAEGPYRGVRDPGELRNKLSRLQDLLVEGAET